MDRQFDIHNIERRQQSIIEATEGLFPLPEEYQQQSDVLDRQVVQIQLHCEKICRMIYRPDSPFSPDYSLWDKRKKMFQQLMRVQHSRRANRAVVYKKARKLGIVASKYWTNEELTHAVGVCVAWKKRLLTYAPCLRIEHQQRCLLDAEASGDVDRA